jgi:hypothetical protein
MAAVASLLAMDRTTLTAALKPRAFRLGEHSGRFTDYTPLLASVFRNSAVNNGSRSWIKYSLPTTKLSAITETGCHPPGSSRAIRLPSHSPANSTRRLDKSMRFEE